MKTDLKDAGAKAANQTTGIATRLASVDALRGFDMFWIIGGRELLLAFAALFASPVPAWLEWHLDHPPWGEPFSSWDLIMPLFLFISGVSMPFSLSKWMADGKKKFYLRLARRIAILWILGMAVQGNLLEWDLSKLKLYSNTLQAIAAGYLVATLFLLTMSLRGQIIATVSLLVGFWLLLLYMPFPERVADPYDQWNNAAKYVDKLVLGQFTDKWLYTWVLSSLGFGATVMAGVFGGYVLRAKVTEQRKFVALLGMGVGCLAAGWVWSFWFPMIKYIWTSSMNLWACGWCFLLLGLFYWVIDVKGYRRWAFPLVVIGMNAIAIYAASHLLDFGDVSDVFVGKLAPQLGAFGDFLKAFCTVMVALLILLYMYRKKTFIRL